MMSRYTDTIRTAITTYMDPPQRTDEPTLDLLEAMCRYEAGGTLEYCSDEWIAAFSVETLCHLEDEPEAIPLICGSLQVTIPTWV
ncbi:MAG TPA: hypothetical protein VNJ04_19300 [Gemmatimonadaceae bacterium]|nr:hypothetical protein [Gemmatimonadaceae bacterium]